MDGPDFDALTRTLTAPLSRRVTLGGLAAGVLSALGLAPDETAVVAKKKKGGGKGKGQKCPAGKVRCGGKCRQCCTSAHCQGNPQFEPWFVCRNRRCIECTNDDACALYYGGGKPYCMAGLCRECRTSADCPADRPGCIAGECVQHCGNGVLDGDESDVDCGGRCPGKCLNGRGCFFGGDCQSGICVGGTCRECEVALDCPGSKPHCSAQGECVACTEDAHCSQNAFHVCQNNRCVISCPPQQPVYCARYCWPAGTVCCADDSPFGGEICAPDPEYDFVCYSLEPGQRPSLCCPAEWLCGPHECRPGGCD